MSDKPREARTIHNFIVGLQLLGDTVVSANFPDDYDSGVAGFGVEGEVDPVKMKALEALGFFVGTVEHSSPPGTPNSICRMEICFREWEDS